MTPAHGSFTQESIARIDELVMEVQGIPDPAARGSAVELLQAVMSLHAAAFERFLDITSTRAPELVELIGADDLLSRMLVLHGLHPDEFAVRLARAVEHLRRHFDSRGARIEVIEPGPEIVRLRVSGIRPKATTASRKTIEDAIYEAAPEVGELIVEGLIEQPEPGFVSLESLLTSQPA